MANDEFLNRVAAAFSDTRSEAEKIDDVLTDIATLYKKATCCTFTFTIEHHEDGTYVHVGGHRDLLVRIEGDSPAGVLIDVTNAINKTL